MIYMRNITITTAKSATYLENVGRNNVETHLYALTHAKIGPERHRQKRKFASLIGMRRHIVGLIAFAHQVDKEYAAKLYAELNAVNWKR